MSAYSKQDVNHKLYKDVYFDELTDDEKDKVYYKIAGKDAQVNYKQFIIEQPRLRLQLTDYLYNLIVEEMFNDNFHGIRYKEVDNKQFYHRIKSKECSKIRFYYQDRWITYYFNVKSKSKATESDLPVTIMMFASYPAKGMFNVLHEPCLLKTFAEGQPATCDPEYWGISCGLKGFENLITEDYAYLHIPPDSDEGPCYVPEYRLSDEDFFYNLPGNKDYMLEAYTIDYDKGTYNCKGVEYYIVDREQDYFTKGTTNWTNMKETVLKRFNQNPKRLEVFHNGPDTNKVVPFRKDNEFETTEDLFKYTARSWVGRHNAFVIQYNRYMGFFNQATDGYFCPAKGLHPPKPVSMPSSTFVDTEMATKKSGDVIQEQIDGYTPKDLSINVLEDIKILTMVEYLKFNIASDKWLDALNINEDTVKNFSKYAVTHFQLTDAY